MGKRSGVGSGVVALLLGLTASCGGRYDVGSGDGEAGTGGDQATGGSSTTGGTGSSTGGSSPGAGGASSTGGASAVGGTGSSTGGTGTAVGGTGSSTGGAGSEVGGSGVAGGTSAGSGGSAAAPACELPQTENIAHPQDVWSRISRFLFDGEVGGLPEQEEVFLQDPELVGSFVWGMLDARVNDGELDPALGIARFFDDWAFASEGWESARVWGRTFVTHALQNELFQSVGGRGSFLTDASFLRAYPTPGRRGYWMVRNLFCLPELGSIAPPKPTFPEGPFPDGVTRRQAYQAEVSTPACAGCHSVLDPLGFSLEHYDENGDYREFDNGAAVDASGSWSYEGLSYEFEDFEQLSAELAVSPEVGACLARKVFDYALSRVESDAPVPRAAEVEYVTCEFRRNGAVLTAMLAAITQTPSFLEE